MYRLEHCILVTNNDRVAQRFEGRAGQVLQKQDHRSVLIAARDLIYEGHPLLTHPQASSLKPNQTPYRSIVLYQDRQPLSREDIERIERAIEVYDQWQQLRPTPSYQPALAEDFKTIDLSMIEGILQRL